MRGNRSNTPSLVVQLVRTAYGFQAERIDIVEPSATNKSISQSEPQQ